LRAAKVLVAPDDRGFIVARIQSLMSVAKRAAAHASMHARPKRSVDDLI